MAPSVRSTNEATIAGNGADEEYANVNWDALGFDLTPTDYMYLMKCSIGDGFLEGKVIPYGNIELSPAAGILNYGQGLFEGLKAYRREDGRIVLFRPEENALRMKMGAERLHMSCPTTEQFINAVKQTVIANKRWVPPPGIGTLYLRPLLIGSGAGLGVGPSHEYTFVIYASPVGHYYKGEMNLFVDDKVFRACPGGTGGIKSVTNYAPVYDATCEAKAKGFSDVLFLDAATGKNIEEVVACNIFIVKGHSISTPAIHGTILPGVTRKSIIELALDIGYQVEERDVSLEEVLNAEEAFCTGTAVVVSPVKSITYQDKRMEYKTGDETVAEKLHAALTGIQGGVVKDTKGWIVEVV